MTWFWWIPLALIPVYGGDLRFKEIEVYPAVNGSYERWQLSFAPRDTGEAQCLPFFHLQSDSRFLALRLAGITQSEISESDLILESRRSRLTHSLELHDEIYENEVEVIWRLPRAVTVKALKRRNCSLSMKIAKKGGSRQ